MRLTKSLIAAFSAFLATGAAFAGGDSWTSTGLMSSDSAEAGGLACLAATRSRASSTTSASVQQLGNAQRDGARAAEPSSSLNPT